MDSSNFELDDNAPFQPWRMEAPAVGPTPNNPPWNGWIAILAWLMSVVLIALFPALLAAPYLVSLKGQFETNQELMAFAVKDPTMLLLQVVGIIPAHIATLLLSWLIITKFRQYSFRDTLGWSMGGMRWWHFVMILLAFFALAVSVTHFYPEGENELLRLLQSSRSAVFVIAFMATFTAPIVEEVIYRGILYSAFQRAAGAVPAILIVTGLFTAVHVPQYWPSYSTIALLLLLSLILTLIRYRTGNLLPCIVLHTIFNGFQSVLLILEPYLPKEAGPTEVSATVFRFL